jgi:hypothetical protein
MPTCDLAWMIVTHCSVAQLRMLSFLIYGDAGPTAQEPAHWTLRTCEAVRLRPCNDALVQLSLFHRLCSRYRWPTMLHTWLDRVKRLATRWLYNSP